MQPPILADLHFQMETDEGSGLRGSAEQAHGSERNMRLYWGAWGACVVGSRAQGLRGCGSWPHEGCGMQLMLRKFGYPDCKHTYIWRCIVRYLSLS